MEVKSSTVSYSYGMAALGLYLLMFTAGMCPVAGNMCDMKALALSKGQVGIACPLTSDVYQMDRRTVIIKLVPEQPRFPVTVLACQWLASRGNVSCSHKFDVEMIEISSNRILARSPQNSLGNGTFRCQLAPPDDPTFTECVTCDPDGPTSHHPTANTSQALPTTAATSAILENQETGAGGQYHGGLVTAVVMLSITVFILLLAMAAMVLFFIRYRRMRKQADKRTPEENERFTSGEETV